MWNRRNSKRSRPLRRPQVFWRSTNCEVLVDQEAKEDECADVVSPPNVWTTLTTTRRGKALVVRPCQTLCESGVALRDDAACRAVEATFA